MGSVLKKRRTVWNEGGGTIVELWPARVIVVQQRVVPNNWTVMALRGGVKYESTGNTEAERTAEARRLVELHIEAIQRDGSAGEKAALTKQLAA